MKFLTICILALSHVIISIGSFLILISYLLITGEYQINYKSWKGIDVEYIVPIYQYIISIFILLICILVGRYLIKDLNFQKIDKKLLKNSLIAGIIFGIVAFIFGINIYGSSEDLAVLILRYSPFVLFITGSFFWYLIFNNRPISVLNGIKAGILTASISHPLTWYTIVRISRFDFFSNSYIYDLDFFIDVILNPLMNVLLLLLYSIILGIPIIILTVIIGGFTGGMIALIYNRNKMEILNVLFTL